LVQGEWATKSTRSVEFPVACKPQHRPKDSAERQAERNRQKKKTQMRLSPEGMNARKKKSTDTIGDRIPDLVEDHRVIASNLATGGIFRQSAIIRTNQRLAPFRTQMLLP